jgi:hypothetical protein
MTQTKTAVQTPLEKMRQSFPKAYEKSNGYWTHDDNPHFDFREEEDGHISIHPWTGRSVEAILAMGEPALKMSDLYVKNGKYKPAYREPQFDLVTLAWYMKLPHGFLSSIGYRDEYPYINRNHRKTVCVKLGGYFDTEGNEHSKVRVRLNIDGKTRFLFDRSTPGEIFPTGLDRLDEARAKGFTFIGEGESDDATMRFHGIPFLGIPGADHVKCVDVSLLQGIDRLYIIEEPDQAKKNSETGQGFYARMRQHLRDNGYTGKIFSIRFQLATGYKDPSNLHKGMYFKCDETEEAPHAKVIKAKFAEAISKAMERAIPEGNTALITQEDFAPDPTPAAPVTESDRLQWIAQLCAVPSSKMSPAHKIVLMVILLHSPIWNQTGEYWFKVDAAHLAPLAAMPKREFLKHLSYLTKNLNLFKKDHRRTWYTPDGPDSKKKKCTTELFIQPSQDVWLTYPSTWRVTDGAEERKHGGPTIPKPTCESCGSEELDIDEIHHCRKCNALRIIHKVVDPEPEETDEQEEEEEEEAAVESTVEVLPLESEEPQAEDATIDKTGILPKNTPATPNLGMSHSSLSINDTQLGYSTSEDTPTINTPTTPKLGMPVVSPGSLHVVKRCHICKRNEATIWWPGEKPTCEECSKEQKAS